MIDPKIEALRAGLIVSVQAYPGEPMRNPETMAQIAHAAVLGGARAIRCQGLADIAAIATRVDVPVIGLWKDGHDGVYITPTLRHGLACVNAGADIVAVDATERERPDGSTFAHITKGIHDAGALVMADCDTVESAVEAHKAGADIVSTTLAGYTENRPKSKGPDLELLREVVAACPKTPVFCEGRIHTLDQARQVMEAGAWAAVVGTAITHPTSVTTWFKDAVEKASRADKKLSPQV